MDSQQQEQRRQQQQQQQQRQLQQRQGEKTTRVASVPLSSSPIPSSFCSSLDFHSDNGNGNGERILLSQGTEAIVENPERVEQLLVTELNQMSLENRERILEDIHGANESSSHSNYYYNQWNNHGNGDTCTSTNTDTNTNTNTDKYGNGNNGSRDSSYSADNDFPFNHQSQTPPLAAPRDENEELRDDLLERKTREREREDRLLEQMQAELDKLDQIYRNRKDSIESSSSPPPLPSSVPVSVLSAHARARDLESEWIRDRQFLWSFLHREYYRPRLAAIRLVRYLQLLGQAFEGNDAVLQRPVCLEDLSPTARSVMHIDGPLQILPIRDSSGRRIFVLLRDPPADCSLVDQQQIGVYFAQTLSEDRDGAVWVYFFHNISQKLLDLDRLRMAYHMMSVLPMKFDAVHLCFPNLPIYDVCKSLISLYLGRENRIRRRIHVGSYDECKYSLRVNHGIGVDRLPINLELWKWSHDLDMKYFRKWLAMRAAKEQALLRAIVAVEFAAEKTKDCDSNSDGRKNCNGSNGSNDIDINSNSNSNDSTDPMGIRDSTATATTTLNPTAQQHKLSGVLDALASLRSKFVECPYHEDCLFGKGSSVKNHPGNVAMRTLVAKRYHGFHVTSKCNIEKQRLAYEVVQTIKIGGGRFLKEVGLEELSLENDGFVATKRPPTVASIAMVAVHDDEENNNTKNNNNDRLLFVEVSDTVAIQKVMSSFRNLKKKRRKEAKIQEEQQKQKRPKKGQNPSQVIPAMQTQPQTTAATTGITKDKNEFNSRSRCGSQSSRARQTDATSSLSSSPMGPSSSSSPPQSITLGTTRKTTQQRQNENSSTNGINIKIHSNTSGSILDVGFSTYQNLSSNAYSTAFVVTKSPQPNEHSCFDSISGGFCL